MRVDQQKLDARIVEAQEKMRSNGATEDQDKRKASPRNSTSEILPAVPRGFRLNDRGVYKLRHEEHDEKRDEKPQWICAPLQVLAYTRSTENEDWGKSLSFRDPDGLRHEWLMTMAMLAKDGAEFRAKLRSLGLRISAAKSAPNDDTFRWPNLPRRCVRLSASVGTRMLSCYPMKPSARPMERWFGYNLRASNSTATERLALSMTGSETWRFIAREIHSWPSRCHAHLQRRCSHSLRTKGAVFI